MEGFSMIRLFYNFFSHFVGGMTLFVISGAAAQAQYSLPSPANGALQLPAGPLKVRSWDRPLHSSMVGKRISDLAGQAAAGATIPLWTGAGAPNFPNDQFMMVGLDPTVHHTSPVSTIKTQVIPVKFLFPSNVFDPTKRDACTRTPALTSVSQSPIFRSVNLKVGGTSLGSGQFVSLFQRANFFTYTGPGKINPGYQVKLTYTTLPELTVQVTGGPPVHNGPCDPLGLIEVNAWDDLVVNTILPQLATHGVGPTTLPIFLFYNVAMYDTVPGNCCILGYHGAFTDGIGALHTYSVVDYDETGAFGSSVQDITVMSHEIAEWMDDPTGLNPTPPWGNTGQVTTGCQNNLEVGDPLNGTLEIPSNFATVYHVQDLAFKSWFYHDAPSTGVNGWYSLYGTFLNYAANCPP
jgi:hypothetical protein